MFSLLWNVTGDRLLFENSKAQARPSGVAVDSSKRISPAFTNIAGTDNITIQYHYWRIYWSCVPGNSSFLPGSQRAVFHDVLDSGVVPACPPSIKTVTKRGRPFSSSRPLALTECAIKINLPLALVPSTVATHCLK